MYLADASARNVSSFFSLYESNVQDRIQTMTEAANLLSEVRISKALTNASTLYDSCAALATLP